MGFIDEMLAQLSSGIHKLRNKDEDIKSPIYRQEDFSQTQNNPPEDFITSLTKSANRIGEQVYQAASPVVEGTYRNITDAIAGAYNNSIQKNINDKIANVPATPFGVTVGQIGQMGIDTLRAAPRAAASLSLDAMKQGQIDPSTWSEKLVFGDSPVKSLSRNINEAKDTLGGYGVKGSAVDYGVPLVLGALTVADLIPLGVDGVGVDAVEQTSKKFLSGLDDLVKSSNSSGEIIKNIDEAVRLGVSGSKNNVSVLEGIRGALTKKITTIKDDVIRGVLQDHIGILDELIVQANKAQDAGSLASDVRLPNMNTSAGETALPSDVLASKPLPSAVSDTMTVSPSNKYSPTASVDDILKSPSFQDKYTKTTAEKPFLDNLLSSISGDRKFSTQAKDINTAASKIVRKLEFKPNYSEDSIGDMLRGNIIANDSSDAQSLLHILEQNVKIESVENYVDKPTVWGYQGININIRTPNGNLAEVQIHTPESIAVQKALHPLYEKWRGEKVIPTEVYEQSKKVADETRAAFKNGVGTHTGAEIDPLPNVIINEQGKLQKTNKPNKYVFDLKSLNTPDDVKNTILEMAKSENESIQTARRGTITWQKTREMADALGMSVDDVMKRKPGKMYSAEEMDAATRLMLGSAEKVRGIQSQIREIKDAGGEVPQDLRDQLMAQALQLKGLQSSVIGARSEAGRTLNASKMLKDALSETDKTKAQREINKIFGGDKEKTKKMLDQLEQFDSNDTLGMIKFIQSVKPTTPIDVVSELWYNSVLSNTATHLVNFVGNSMSTALRLPEKVVSSFIDATLTGAGRAAGMSLQRERYVSEVGAEVASIRSGFINGIRKAAYVFQNGLTATDATKFDVSGGQAIPGLVGNLVNIPSKSLVASDELFKGINYEMSLWANAMRQAKNEGKSGVELTQRIADLVSSPDSKMIKTAMDEAKYRLFQEGSNAANGIRAFRDNVAKINIPLIGELKPIQFILPFVQTPLNVVKYGLERSPAGILSVAEGVLNGASKGEIADRTARAMMGSALMVPLAMYFTEDKITGAPPKDRTERDAFYADGKLPYSIKIGDRWYAYNRVEPFNTILTQIAMWHDSFKNNDHLLSQETIADFIRGTVMNFADQTFMTGLGNLVNAVEDPERYGQKFITDIIGGFVPSIVAAGARTVDPTVRDSKTVVDDLKVRVPLLSKDVPARESKFEPNGQAVRKGDLLTQIINNFTGFRSSPAGTDDIQGKIRELKKMNSEARDISAENKTDALNMLDEIQKTTPEERGSLVEKFIQEGRLDDKSLTVMINSLEERSLGLKGEESYLKNSSVSTRAQFIYDEVQKMPPEKRGEYFDRMQKTGILTESVMDQFIEIAGKNKQDSIPLVK